MPEKINVKLEIFNSREEKIKTLLDEIIKTGTYKVEFNPNGFTDAIYLHKLTAGSIIPTKKMILNR